MKQRHLHDWVWADALTLFDRAERLRRQFFRLSREPVPGPATAELPSWEPPIDVIETLDGLRILVALPGVAAEDVTVALTPEGVGVLGLRRFPAAGGGARIHRVEIPYGRFERHIALPADWADVFDLRERSLRDGCLTLAFRRKDEGIV